MKLLNYFSITACALSLGLSSCSEDESTTTAPSLPEMGITSPVTGIYKNGEARSLFTYKDGKLVGGESREFGKFNIGYSPLKISGSSSYDEDNYRESSKTNIHSIKTNTQGFITTFGISGTSDFEEYQYDKEKGTSTAKGTGTVEYTAEGYIKKMSIKLTINSTFTYIEDGKTKTGKESETSTKIITFVWKNGNLDSLSCTNEWAENKEEPQKETYSYSFTYGTTINNGIFHWSEFCDEDMPSFDFFFYGGFLGKPSKNTPVEIKDHNDVYPIQTRVENNKVTGLSYGYSQYTYQYGSNAPQNLKTLKRANEKIGMLKRTHRK